MLESKASNQLADPEVMTKRDVAQTWCAHASAYAVRHGGKPWSYVLVPDDSIAENMTLERLAFL